MQKNYKSVVFVAPGTLGNTVRFILPQRPLYRSSDGSTFSLLEIRQIHALFVTYIYRIKNLVGVIQYNTDQSLVHSFSTPASS